MPEIRDQLITLCNAHQALGQLQGLLDGPDTQFNHILGALDELRCIITRDVELDQSTLGTLLCHDLPRLTQPVSIEFQQMGALKLLKAIYDNPAAEAEVEPQEYTGIAEAAREREDAQEKPQWMTETHPRMKSEVVSNLPEIPDSSEGKEGYVTAFRRCTKCKEKKHPVRDFNKRKANKDGLDTVCKDCRKEYGRDYRDTKRREKQRQINLAKADHPKGEQPTPVPTDPYTGIKPFAMSNGRCVFYIGHASGNTYCCWRCDNDNGHVAVPSLLPMRTYLSLDAALEALHAHGRAEGWTTCDVPSQAAGVATA